MMNVLEAATVPATVAAYFTAVGETITGMLVAAVNVFNGLWTSGIPGQVICTMGIGGTLIGLGLALFRIKGGRRRK